jgi:hypothetical protein
MQIKFGCSAGRHTYGRELREHPMTTDQMYYLILVCAAFLTFMVVVAANTIHYRRWIKEQAGPVRPVAKSLPVGSASPRHA